MVPSSAPGLDHGVPQSPGAYMQEKKDGAGGQDGEDVWEIERR